MHETTRTRPGPPWAEAEGDETVRFNTMATYEPPVATTLGAMRAELALYEAMWSPLKWAPPADASEAGLLAFRSGAGAVGYSLRERHTAAGVVWECRSSDITEAVRDLRIRIAAEEAAMPVSSSEARMLAAFDSIASQVVPGWAA